MRIISPPLVSLLFRYRDDRASTRGARHQIQSTFWSRGSRLDDSLSRSRNEEALSPDIHHPLNFR